MSTIQILLSSDFLFAIGAYALAIIIALPCFNKIHRALDHSILEWPWDHIGMPWLRAILMLIFISFAYPVIFGIPEGPAFTDLLAGRNNRINFLVNVLFLVTLLFPLIPVLGDCEELVLPAQAIAACSLLFSWLAAELQLEHISYWPGILNVFYILLLAFITHRLALTLSHPLSKAINMKFEVADSEQLISRALVLFMQSPAILIYSAALGRQLH